MYGIEQNRTASRARSIARAFLLTFPVALLLALAALGGCRSAHTTSAILYIDEQNYAKAVQVIHEGFEFTQDEPDAFYYLGEAHSHLAEEAVTKDEFAEALKNYGLAYDAYKKARELKPEEWTERVNTALAYNYKTRLGQAKIDWDSRYYEQAEGHMRLAYAALPDSLTPIKSIARMKIQMSETGEYAEKKTELLNEGLEMLDQVLVANPTAYELQLDKAYVLATLGRTEEAAKIYNDLLAAHGEDTDLLVQVATLAADQKDYARAADMYVKIVDLYEKDADTTNDGNNIAMLVSAGLWYGNKDIMRYDEAIAVLERAIVLETFPTENTLVARLRTVYNYGKHLKDSAPSEADPARKQQMLDKAAELFRRSVELGNELKGRFPGNAQGYLYLSMAQLEVGDPTGADESFKRYQELAGSGAGQ